MDSGIEGVTLGNLSPYMTDSPLKSNCSDDTFQNILSSMIGSLDETNDLQNIAEQEEVRFALGESENTHDLLIAQTKANIALQYTVAIRDKVVEAYKEIMQIQV